MERTVFVSALLALVSALCTADGLGNVSITSEPIFDTCSG